MDTLTHALSGALLVSAARSSLPETDIPPLRMLITAGFVAAVFPDLDFALRVFDTLIYLNWHQGPTHSLLMLPIWAYLLARLFSWAVHGSYPWRAFFVPACLGIAIHIMGDLITSYGLMLFAPFSFQRYSIPLVFVIDPWFSLIIMAGLILSLLFPQRRILAVLILICLVGYVAFLWTLHQRAINVGQDFAKTRQLIYADINVLPQPLSPLNWKVIVSDGDSYHVALINLGHNKNENFLYSNLEFLRELAANYTHTAMVNWQQFKLFGDSLADTELAREAWYQSDFSDFKQFSVFPVLDRIEHGKVETCAWFFDLRFSFPTLPPSFRYGMCRNNDTLKWRILRHRGSFWID